MLSLSSTAHKYTPSHTWKHNAKTLMLRISFAPTHLKLMPTALQSGSVVVIQSARPASSVLAGNFPILKAPVYLVGPVVIRAVVAAAAAAAAAVVVVVLV
jgi:hypothetical protein